VTDHAITPITPSDPIHPTEITPSSDRDHAIIYPVGWYGGVACLLMALVHEESQNKKQRGGRRAVSTSPFPN
jgi:hypothetical protein